MKGNAFVIARRSEVTLKLDLKFKVMKFEKKKKKKVS
jgi:hypothetical protein